MSELSRRAAIGGGLALVGASALPLTRLASAESAIPARRFMDSIGICTHPGRRDGAWSSSDWQGAFLETGVMHTRGKIGHKFAGRNALAGLQPLFARGVKICATVADQKGGLDRDGTLANLDFLAGSVGAQNLSGIESANEYNKPGDRSSDWAAELRDFQRWLHDTVRANPAFNGVPLIGPSVWGRVTEDYVALGDLGATIDRACLHYYTGGRRPTRAGRPGGKDEGGGARDYGLGDAIADARRLAPGKPLWITEYGYPIAGPGLPPSGNFVTERAAAKYLLRGLFDAFVEGVERTYVYSLIDDVQRNPPRYHGLTDGALGRRQTFYALRNLMGLFADRSAAPAPRNLDYAVRNAPPGLRRQLFHKSDGSFLLAMYLDVDSYDRAAKRDLNHAPSPVALSFSSPVSIEMFTPSTGPASVHSVKNAQTLTLPIGDQVSILRITP